jgi:hypothetical protein
VKLSQCGRSREAVEGLSWVGVNLVKLSEDEGDVDFALSVYARGSHQQKRGGGPPVGVSYNRYKRAAT